MKNARPFSEGYDNRCCKIYKFTQPLLHGQYATKSHNL